MIVSSEELQLPERNFSEELVKSILKTHSGLRQDQILVAGIQPILSPDWDMVFPIVLSASTPEETFRKRAKTQVGERFGDPSTFLSLLALNVAVYVVVYASFNRAIAQKCEPDTDDEIFCAIIQRYKELLWRARQ